jgi:hypothetical protein
MSPLEWFTLVLVLITAYNAWQTHRMVREMRDSRVAAHRPRIIPVIEYDEAKRGFIWIENLGPGAALDIDVTLTFEPRSRPFRLRCNLLRAGDRRNWNPSSSHEGEKLRQEYHPDAQLPNDTDIRLDGSCRDTLGQVWLINERITVLGKWEMLPKQDDHG